MDHQLFLGYRAKVLEIFHHIAQQRGVLVPSCPMERANVCIHVNLSCDTSNSGQQNANANGLSLLSLSEHPTEDEGNSGHFLKNHFSLGMERHRKIGSGLATLSKSCPEL